jgi:ribosome-binding factor A
LNEVVLEVLAEELERMSDPRLSLVTLTGVEVSRDLSRATVYYSALAGTMKAVAERAPEATAAALASAAPHLRGVLGREVRVKKVPRLVFVEDPAIAAGERIDSILRAIHPGSGDEHAGEGE